MHLSSVFLGTASLFAAMITGVHADKDCCYKWTDNTGKYSIEVSWDYWTQSGTCHGDAPSNYANLINCAVQTGVSGDGRFLFANVFMDYKDGNGGDESISWHFGMNNNECKFLTDKQVQKTITTTDPKVDFLSGKNVASGGVCQ